MRLGQRDIAKLAYGVQQQALIQLGGAAGVPWELLSFANQEPYLYRVQRALNTNQASGSTPNAATFTIPLAGTGFTAFTGALTTNAAIGGYANVFPLKAATSLTGTASPGDTFVIAGITYTICAPALAAANIANVLVDPPAPAAGITSGTTWSAYTAQTANNAKSGAVFDQAVLCCFDLLGG
jgi:hypothetical protein